MLRAVCTRTQARGLKESCLTIGTGIRTLSPLRGFRQGNLKSYSPNGLVRVQRLRNDLYKAVKGPSTRPLVLSIIAGSYWLRRRRFTISKPDEMNRDQSRSEKDQQQQNWDKNVWYGCSEMTDVTYSRWWTRKHVYRRGCLFWEKCSNYKIITDKANKEVAYTEGIIFIIT